MPLDREITAPTLGAEPTAILWKSSLRSPISSGSVPHRSRSRTRSKDAQATLRSSSPSPLRQQVESTSPANISSGKLRASFSKSREINEIENEYVKNLQQQIYFLELEANYLREQARKATEMHPQMRNEADRMLEKLRSLQAEADGLQVEVRRKDASIQLVTREKSKVLSRLADEENAKERMKRSLIEEIDKLKQEKDSLSFDNNRLGTHIERLLQEKESLTVKLNETQSSSVVLRTQIDDISLQLDRTKVALEEKRNQCLASEYRAKEVEEHYLNVTSRAYEKDINSLKEEIRLLNQQLRDMERQASDERYLKTKATLENEELRKSGTKLNADLISLNTQLNRERDLVKELDLNRSDDLVRISRLSEKEKELNFELNVIKQQLNEEKERSERYLLQLHKLEDTSSKLELNGDLLNKKLTDVEIVMNSLTKENASLKKDREILQDHIADLQKKLNSKQDELLHSQKRILALSDNLESLKTDKAFDDTINNEQWRKFESLADNMKQLSSTMARSGSPNRSPRLTGRLS